MMAQPQQHGSYPPPTTHYGAYSPSPHQPPAHYGVGYPPSQPHGGYPPSHQTSFGYAAPPGYGAAPTHAAYGAPPMGSPLPEHGMVPALPSVPGMAPIQMPPLPGQSSSSSFSGGYPPQQQYAPQPGAGAPGYYPPDGYAQPHMKQSYASAPAYPHLEQLGTPEQEKPRRRRKPKKKQSADDDDDDGDRTSDSDEDEESTRVHVGPNGTVITKSSSRSSSRSSRRDEVPAPSTSTSASPAAARAAPGSPAGSSLHTYNGGSEDIAIGGTQGAVGTSSLRRGSSGKVKQMKYVGEPKKKNAVSRALFGSGKTKRRNHYDGVTRFS